jgi:prolyl oligopeptidase
MKNKKQIFDIEKIPMRNLLYFVLIIFTLRTQGQILNNSLKSDTSIINNYFGIEVTDTYRWLEDSNSPKTMEWIKKQEKLSSDYFKKLDTRIYDKLLNYSYIFFDPLIKKGKYYFLFQYDYIGKTPSLYYKTRIDDVAKIIIDPTNFKENKN